MASTRLIVLIMDFRARENSGEKTYNISAYLFSEQWLNRTRGETIFSKNFLIWSKTEKRGRKATSLLNPMQILKSQEYRSNPRRRSIGNRTIEEDHSQIKLALFFSLIHPCNRMIINQWIRKKTTTKRKKNGWIQIEDHTSPIISIVIVIINENEAIVVVLMVSNVETCRNRFRLIVFTTDHTHCLIARHIDEERKRIKAD